jgi:hypothetical protein
MLSPAARASISLGPGRIRPFALACILLTASIIPAVDYGFGPGDATLTARREIHRGILNHSARAPDRYRWLAAAIVEPAIHVLEPSMGYDRAFDRVSTMFYLAAITAMLWSLFAFLRTWFSDEASLLAPLVASCTMHIAMRQYDYAPYSFLEPTFVTLALLAIVQRKEIRLGILIALASFNRETAVFLVPLYLVTSDWSRQAWIKTAIYGATWAAIFVGVRIVSGDAERYWTVERILRTNLTQPQLALANLSMLFGAFWIFAPLGWRAAPAFIRRASLIIPPYLVTVAVWGIWWEVRLLMPIYPIVFALALSYLQDSKWPAWTVAAILVTAVAVNAFDYSVLVPQPQLRYEMHAAIASGGALSPERYRILVPWLLDPVIRAASSLMAPDLAFRRVYSAFHLAALTALLGSVYAYARLWFSRERALVGALVAGTTLHLVLRMGEYWDFSPIPVQSWFTPWSLLEPVFVAAILILIRTRRWAALAVVLLLAALNSGLAAAVSVLTTPFSALGENLSHLPSVLINLFLFLGPAIVLVVTGFPRAPRFAQRSLLAVAIPLVAGVTMYAYWWDVRLLTALYPVLAVPLLAAAFPPQQRADGLNSPA